ncbi:hypothetical protein Anapl_14604 [Anas platyrhynchos]|uniref:Uncharacterized protein n=1 Tax=Anas platyrhynchos TaxID=8839 RepID=R0JL43_ANAPL|nr:hypothetical protein Anapl_14604 [Anas platyrhynchos]
MICDVSENVPYFGVFPAVYRVPQQLGTSLAKTDPAAEGVLGIPFLTEESANQFIRLKRHLPYSENYWDTSSSQNTWGYAVIEQVSESWTALRDTAEYYMDMKSFAFDPLITRFFHCCCSHSRYTCNIVLMANTKNMPKIKQISSTVLLVMEIHAPTYNCLFPFTPVFTSIKADEGHLLLNYEKSEDQQFPPLESSDDPKCLVHRKQLHLENPFLKEWLQQRASSLFLLTPPTQKYQKDCRLTEATFCSGKDAVAACLPVALRKHEEEISPTQAPLPSVCTERSLDPADSFAGLTNSAEY